MISSFETDDLTAPEVNADPYQYFGWLRETHPVHWNPLFKSWIVTRYGDVTWLIRNHEQFSSAIPPDAPVDTYPPIDEADWELADWINRFRPFMLHDRPEHLEMRQTIHRWFTPKAVEKWRGELRAKVRDLIDARRADGQMEIKGDFAAPLPLMAICWMLGVPAVDAPRLRDLAATALEPGFGPDRTRIAVPAFRELEDYFSPVIDARAKDPAEDLISMLADGERRGIFTRDQCLASVVHLMLAGHSTTLALICNGILAFIRNPAQWDLLQEDPAGMCASATEECLRYDPSLKLLIRVSTQEIELGGESIRAGDKVFWVIASANRDPRAFSDPDTFDITRAPNHHVAFGGGIHHCVGSALARIEGQEAFRALAENLPRLQLQADDVEYVPNLIERTVRTLHVSWN